MRDTVEGKTHRLRTMLGVSAPANFGLALLAVAAMTAAIALAKRFVELDHVGAIYLIPVLISAMRWGLAPALLVAVSSIGASAFFFYPPIFSFQVHRGEQIVDLIVFTIAAVITSQLAVSLRRQAEIADRAIREARMRADTDQLREALIGSVSHELRTPLASILGATTALAGSPAVAAQPRLAALANVARDEAERLNSDIQNLLDASRISSEGLRPRLGWTEVADIVNAGLERCRARLAEHVVDVALPEELPLVFVDAVLIEQALGQVLDNARKYSPAGTSIRLSGRREADHVVVTVADEGAGLTADEAAHIGERFFRGPRHQASTPGSGLGLWIAEAFLRANGGSLTVTSAGEGRGVSVDIRLPAPPDDTDHGIADE
jgi:K+-sensing histidine kinase KdpD